MREAFAELGFVEDVTFSAEELLDQLQAAPAESPPSRDRDIVARWVAVHHFAASPDLSDIYYLPENCAPSEIRLLEVNHLVTRAQDGIEALDVGFDVVGLDYKLLVADLSPAEHERLRLQGLDLPDGCTLRGAAHWKRRSLADAAPRCF